MIGKPPYRYWALVLSFIITFVIFPNYVYAHPGTGPAFLKINEQYAVTNSYAIPGIPASYDIAPQVYLVNTPINFTIDTANLLLPPETIAKTTFRWQETGSTDYSYGTSFNKLYTKPGTYIITLDANTTEAPNFQLLDTVEVTVVPNQAYIVPKVRIRVERTTWVRGAQISFSAYGEPKNPQLANYAWYVDGQKLATSSSIRYTTSREQWATDRYVTLIATDTNSIATMAAVRLAGNTHQITIAPVGLADTIVEPVRRVAWHSIILVIGILLISAGIFLVYSNKK